MTLAHRPRRHFASIRAEDHDRSAIVGRRQMIDEREVLAVSARSARSVHQDAAEKHCSDGEFELTPADRRECTRTIASDPSGA